MNKTIFTILSTMLSFSVYSQSLNIVFDGDSQTSSGTWPLKILEMLQADNYSTIRYVNYAVWGQTTSQMVSDVSSQILPRYHSGYDENIVLYYIGYNDTWAGSSLDADAMYNRLVTYYNTLKSAGFKVIMINLPDGINRAGISAYNNMYSNRYSDICDAFVNCRQPGGVFEDYTNTLYYRDNVHLSTTGLNYLAQNYVFPKLLNLIDAPAPPLPPATNLLTGLESYYKFDETANPVKDETGSNNGTASAGMARVAGRNGSAYFFDSNTDYIALSKAYTLKTATFSFWLKISSISDDLLIMANNAYYSRIFIGAKNNLKIETNSNGQEFAFYTPFSLNTWYHITMVRDNDQVTVYRNGVATGTSAIGSSADLSVSQIGFNGRSFRGSLDEIGIWSRALTPSEVLSVYQGSYPFSGGGSPTTIPVSGITVSPATASLLPGTSISLSAVISPQDATNKNVSWSTDNSSVAVVSSSGVVTAVAEGTAEITVTTQDGAKTSLCSVNVSSGTSSTLLTSLRAYYKFDETSGNAKDETGSNNGIVSLYVSRVQGKINGAYYFDDNSDYVTLTSSITHKTATYSFWIKILSLTDDLIIMGSNPYQSRIFIGKNNNLKLETNTNGQEFSFYNAFNTGTWYHIAMVRDNDNLLYYRNGTLIGNGFISNSNQITLTQIGFNGRSFRGVLDEIGIWDRALSLQEIASLYNGSTYPFNALKSTEPVTEDDIAPSLLYYPNPAIGRLYLTSPGMKVEIYDINGVLLLKHENGMEIDLGGIKKGIYFLRINRNDIITTGKLMIQ